MNEHPLQGSLFLSWSNVSTTSTGLYLVSCRSVRKKLIFRWITVGSLHHLAYTFLALRPDEGKHWALGVNQAGYCILVLGMSDPWMTRKFNRYRIVCYNVAVGVWPSYIQRPNETMFLAWATITCGTKTSVRLGQIPLKGLHYRCNEELPDHHYGSYRTVRSNWFREENRP